MMRRRTTCVHGTYAKARTTPTSATPSKRMQIPSFCPVSASTRRASGARLYPHVGHGITSHWEPIRLTLYGRGIVIEFLHSEHVTEIFDANIAIENLP
jgi:hypothetical protein